MGCWILHPVARSTQVCIYGCGSTAYQSSYLRSEQILIDTKRRDRQIALPILYDSAGPAQLNIRMYECTSLRIATETRPIRNTSLALGWMGEGRIHEHCCCLIHPIASDGCLRRLHLPREAPMYMYSVFSRYEEMRVSTS